jgi:hypothetical protein
MLYAGPVAVACSWEFPPTQTTEGVAVAVTVGVAAEVIEVVA